MGRKKKKDEILTEEQNISELTIEEPKTEEIETIEEPKKKKKKDKKKKQEKVEEIENLVSVEENNQIEEPKTEEIETIEEPKKKKKKKKKEEIEETNVDEINFSNVEDNNEQEVNISDVQENQAEENPVLEFNNEEQNIESTTSSTNINKEEDLYAPFGDKTFDKDNINKEEDLYAPFGDKTFNKDGLLDTNTSNNTNDTNTSNNTNYDELFNVSENDTNNDVDADISKIKNDNEYLEHLDADIIKEHIKQKKTPEEQNEFDFEMIKNYMGKNYAEYTTTKFNIRACILGSFYLMYKKIYLYGIIMFSVMTALLTFFFDNIVVLIIILALDIAAHVFIGLKFNKYYLNRSYEQIKKIENKYNANQDDYVLAKTTELGGTNIVATIIISIIFGAAIIAGILLIK